MPGVFLCQAGQRYVNHGLGLYITWTFMRPVPHVACCTRCLLHTLNRAHLCQALIRGFSYVIRNRYIAKRIPPHPRSASVTLDSYATDAYRHISTPPGTKI